MAGAPRVRCARCGEEREALARAPYPGELGRELLARTCAACWSEWQRAEVMVINEYRLNFMDPKAQELLVAQMRQFLALDETPAAG